ncbi:DUF5789 family protein [Natronobacterium gregoryi]|uniref:Uncharacterized protein n=2 Tax=Natronobacterium gregoryi TaxID=44930 RepID=L0AJN9_NATGS|nr:hypothetical protein [Natronobacterium gregoryi]AFZ73402.1 hypothetical protein Natgr_2225 [Natronobacterium gregoryi SP2]ELY68598.1 hypothetical protein C490_09273 [Natronobacterium gregoryi SP2]PLK19679.1 hypothetical protein CYV19_13750 [Natronobacterium gregoryi SP2]SFI72984.1 hypothetical protein SAMN05443661_104101 [Natronobacterium gregoryi]
MGVRPPSNGDDDEPESVEFGIAAVDARLKHADLSFPASKDDVAAELGNERIPYDVHGNDVSLGEMLAEVESTEFRSRQELLNELHEPFEEYRREHSGGVFQQVRSMLPF